jgi:hypothetical protein
MTTTSMVQPKFLTKGYQLGVVAVGFSGGQVDPILILQNTIPNIFPVQTRRRCGALCSDI